MSEDIKSVRKLSNVRLLGLTGSRDLASLYRLCDAMIHITYLDACPNSVVESIVAGCPVICTSEGGTSELVREGVNGLVIPDKPYKFKPINLSKPPHVDTKRLAEAIGSIVGHKLQCVGNHIEHCAEQYKKFFQELL